MKSLYWVLMKALLVSINWLKFLVANNRKFRIKTILIHAFDRSESRGDIRFNRRDNQYLIH